MPWAGCVLAENVSGNCPSTSVAVSSNVAAVDSTVVTDLATATGRSLTATTSIVTIAVLAGTVPSDAEKTNESLPLEFGFGV